MQTIKKVVVVGATGTIGPYIVAALLERSFHVSILTRSISKQSIAPNVTSILTDYSPESLEVVLAGQDAVICALGHAGLGTQFAIIDAAEKVGVKRFIPSEFGSPKGSNDLPEFTALLENKLKIVRYLGEKAQNNANFSWCAFTTGTFLDRALATFPEFGFDLRQHSATIFDSGSEPFSVMSIKDIGRPVAASLEALEQTKNRYVGLSSLQATQNELLDLLQERTGTSWQVERKSTKDVLLMAKKKMAEGDFKGGYVGFMIAQMFEDGCGRALVGGADNELLGTPRKSLEDIVELAYARLEI